MLITIFSAPKAFTNPHIALIQRNAIRSWYHLEDVDVILIGEEARLAETAQELGVRHMPYVQRNQLGTPLVSSIFEQARLNSTSPLLAYVNADILLLPDFVSTARQIASLSEKFLVVGQRWDLDIQQELDFHPGWDERLRGDIRTRGRLHAPMGSDYFIFPRGCFTSLPPFAIGRAGWDNWMLFYARQQRWHLVDASQSIVIAHQDHDYSHLPGGQPHYRLPESNENTRLAGGRRAIFWLKDASHRIEGGQLRSIPWRGPKLWRELEIFPFVSLRSRWLAELAFAIFHPGKAFGEWRGRLAYKLGRNHPKPLGD